MLLTWGNVASKTHVAGVTNKLVHVLQPDKPDVAGVPSGL